MHLSFFYPHLHVPGPAGEPDGEFWLVHSWHEFAINKEKQLETMERHEVRRGLLSARIDSYDLERFLGAAANHDSPFTTHSFEGWAAGWARLLELFDDGTIVALRRRRERELDPTEVATNEERKAAKAFAELQRSTRLMLGRRCILVAGADYGGVRQRERYQVVSRSEAAALLKAAMTTPTILPPSRALLEKAVSLLAPDWRPPGIPQGLVLLRELPAVVGNLSPNVAVSPSQLRALIRAEESVYLEVVLLAPTGKPIGGIPYTIDAPDGEMYDGKLPGSGKTDLTSAKKGPAFVTFFWNEEDAKASRKPAKPKALASDASAQKPAGAGDKTEDDPKPHVAYLQFQYLDWPTQDAPVWKDLTAGFDVEVVAGSDASRASVVGSGAKTDDKGKCKVTLPLALGSAESVFFRVSKQDNPVGRLIPWPWSSFANRALDGKLGRFQDMSADLGAEGSPLVFRLGVYVEVPLTFNVGGTSLPVERQLGDLIGTRKVPEGTEVAVAQRFPGGDHPRPLEVCQFDWTKKQLFRNAFPPSPREDHLSGKGRPPIPDSEASPCGFGHVGEKASAESYGFCCALTSKGGVLRFLVSDLDSQSSEAKKSDIELTVYSRLHDTKYGTAAVEFTTSSSIGEIALNVLPGVDGSLDSRLCHTIIIPRDVGARAPEISEIKAPAQLVPDGQEELRAGLFHMKIARLQNQVMFRLTGGRHRGVPDHRVKLVKGTFKAQRPFCPPGLGVHLIYHPGDEWGDLWSAETAYAVAHERGHDIMWHELSVSFASLVWDFMGLSLLGADYSSNHAPHLETTTLTALYEGWADFCSMFTDWTDAPNTRDAAKSGYPLLPGKITLRNDSRIDFPPAPEVLDGEPELYDLGERCEGVVSNLLWRIYTDVCGLGSSGGQDYARAFVLGKWSSEEHIDEADFPQNKCDLFMKYVWKVFKYFWKDESGKYHAEDHGDPSIRDFVRAIYELNRDPADQATVVRILNLANERMISKAQAMAYLEIQCKGPDGSWIPMPAGVHVEAWDADTISADDFLGANLIGSGGRVVVYMPNKDEKKPDIYFRIAGSKILADGKVVPFSLSTREMAVWRYDTGGAIIQTTEKGYFEDFDKYQIGSSTSPVVFRIDS